MKLSICIIAYNHESFINDCIQGMLSQEIDFPFEIIISDDCSQDNTLGVCKAYAEAYPNIIRLISRPRNLGMTYNWYDTIKECTGEYIALCEGDDFWTNKKKVKSQIDFLDLNEGFSMTFHDVELLGGSKNKSYYFTPTNKTRFNFNDLILHHYIPTCSIMFRKDLVANKIPAEYYKYPVCDVPLELWLASFGDVYRMKQIMAVYRINDASITHDIKHVNSRYRNLIKMYSSLIKIFHLKGLFYFLIKIGKLQIAKTVLKLA